MLLLPMQMATCLDVWTPERDVSTGSKQKHLRLSARLGFGLEDGDVPDADDVLHSSGAVG